MADEDAGVEDLTLDRVRRLHRGEARDWSEFGGNDVPVSAVSRDPDSGTRQALQRQVLGGTQELAATGRGGVALVRNRPGGRDAVPSRAVAARGRARRSPGSADRATGQDREPARAEHERTSGRFAVMLRAVVTGTRLSTSDTAARPAVCSRVH